AGTRTPNYGRTFVAEMSLSETMRLGCACVENKFKIHIGRHLVSAGDFSGKIAGCASLLATAGSDP
ncbi:MAG TPA: hypothetical protein VF957_17490, partial [Bradyrhizobium sp.]